MALQDLEHFMLLTNLFSIMEASNTVPNRKNSSLELYDAWDYYNNAIKENYFSSLAPTSLID